MVFVVSQVPKCEEPGAPGYMSKLFVEVALESGMRTVGVEPTIPSHRTAVLKTAVYASSTTSARGGGIQNAPVCFCGAEWWSPDHLDYTLDHDSKRIV